MLQDDQIAVHTGAGTIADLAVIAGHLHVARCGSIDRRAQRIKELDAMIDIPDTPSQRAIPGSGIDHIPH
jgi:hypothetical protein